MERMLAVPSDEKLVWSNLCVSLMVWGLKLKDSNSRLTDAGQTLHPRLIHQLPLSWFKWVCIQTFAKSTQEILCGHSKLVFVDGRKCIQVEC